MKQESIQRMEQRRQAKLRELAEVGPMLQGSVAVIGVTCGNPNCRCARGDKHQSTILTKKVRGKSKSVYIPADLQTEAKQWAENHRKLKKLIKEISDLSEKILKAHVPAKRARKENQDRAARQTSSLSKTSSP
jgi:hypothetical protein